MPEPLDYESRHEPASVPPAPPLLSYATPRRRRRRRPVQRLTMIAGVLAGTFALGFAGTAALALRAGHGPPAVMCFVYGGCFAAASARLMLQSRRGR
jgi:hypothetical protein